MGANASLPVLSKIFSCESLALKRVRSEKPTVVLYLLVVLDRLSAGKTNQRLLAYFFVVLR